MLPSASAASRQAGPNSAQRKKRRHQRQAENKQQRNGEKSSHTFIEAPHEPAGKLERTIFNQCLDTCQLPKATTLRQM
jgi:hypothetical protein